MKAQKSEQENEQELCSLLQNLIMKDSGISREAANDQISQIEHSIDNISEENFDKLSEKLEPLSDFSQEELIEELNYFIKDLIANDYSEDEQLMITNEVFNSLGLGIEKSANNQYEVKII